MVLHAHSHDALARRGCSCASAIAISYLDRQTLPVAVAAIQRDIPLTNTQFGALQSSFLLAYALMYTGGGALDRSRSARGADSSLIMVVWSLACASHGLATGFWMLAASRFLLGVGEGGGFPAATKAVAEWFPARERSTAMGIVNAGTAVGAVVAPPAIAGDPRCRRAGAGSSSRAARAGLVWTVVVVRACDGRRPSTPSAVGGRAPEPRRPPWSALLALSAQVWGLVVAKFLSDAAWFFYISWLPKYLYDARGFDVKQVGYYAWMPYAASGIGSLLGGWFSSWLLTRGRSVNLSRKLALGSARA